MGNDIGDIAGNVTQMMFPNEKPLECSTSSMGLILMQSDLMQERLSGSMVVADELLEMLWKLLVVSEIDAKER